MPSQNSYWSHSPTFSPRNYLNEPYDLSSSSSMSASPETLSELDLFSPSFYQSSFEPTPDMNFFPMPLSPTGYGGMEDPPMYSPRASMSMPSVAAPAEKTHATSGRRRAQNRAAQRAFRERKEKHARDLEQKLAELTTKYQSLETSHSELTAAYEKLHKTLEILTEKEEAEGGSRSAETLRKFLTILHGELKVKAEREHIAT